MKNKKLAELRLIKKISYFIAKFGNKKYCPICKKSSLFFTYSGLIRRKNACCPHCQALERHRLFWVYLERKTSLFTNKPKNILHIAPERIFRDGFRKIFAECSYLTADLFDEEVDERMDITDIKHPDESFDFIYCSHVLEHVPDDRKAMREFRRVLCSSGTAILLVPITTTRTFEDHTVDNDMDRKALYGQCDHVRRYGPDYQDRLTEAGFIVEKVLPADFLSKEEIIRMGITPAAGEIFICKAE